MSRVQGSGKCPCCPVNRKSCSGCREREVFLNDAGKNLYISTGDVVSMFPGWLGPWLVSHRTPRQPVMRGHDLDGEETVTHCRSIRSQRVVALLSSAKTHRVLFQGSHSFFPRFLEFLFLMNIREGGIWHCCSSYSVFVI